MVRANADGVGGVPCFGHAPPTPTKEIIVSENEINKPESIIAIIDSQILMRQTYADYWARYAISKANHLRVVHCGRDGPPMNEAQLEQDAFDTALNHIRLMNEAIDEKRRQLAKIEAREKSKIC